MALVVFLTGSGNIDRTIAKSHTRGLYTDEIGYLDDALYDGPVAYHQQAASWTPFNYLYMSIDFVTMTTYRLCKCSLLHPQARYLVCTKFSTQECTTPLITQCMSNLKRLSSASQPLWPFCFGRSSNSACFWNF